MSSQQHIIRKLIVELEAPTREEAMDAQNRFALDYKSAILQLLEELFDRLVKAHEVIRIEKLEIDLGDIHPEAFRFAVPEKVKKEMEEALTKLIYELRHSSGKTASVRMSTSAGDSITVEAVRQEQSFSKLEVLLHLLEYGVLPWSGDTKEKGSLRILVAETLERQPEAFRRRLEQLADRPHVFRRLALQLPEDQLQYLAAIMGTAFSSRLPELIAAVLQWLDAFVKRAVAKKVTADFSSRITRTAAWRETLLYFTRKETPAAASGGPAAETAFYTHLLEFFFAESALTAEEIFAALTPAVKKSDPVSIAFFRLAREKGWEEQAVKAQLKKKTGTTTVSKKHSAAQTEETLPAPVPQKKTPDTPLPETPEVDQGIYIDNAGLVLVAPYLSRFFELCGYVKERQFVDDAARWKAVHLLQWMVEGDDTPEKETAEHDLAFNKILCGLGLAEPVPERSEICAEEKENAEELLKAVIANWTIVKNMSVHGFRTTFLQKEGRLKRQGADWHLFIHRDSGVDMLIDRLPWSISIVRFPWSKETVYTEW